LRYLQLAVGIALIAFSALVNVLITIPLAAGMLFVLDGLGVFDRLASSKGGSDGTLSQLDLTILELMSQGKQMSEVSASTGVAPQIIEQKKGALASKGLVTPDGFLTEKGFEALKKK
jgi:hypothetical protein